MTRAEVIACLETLLREDRGTHRSDRKPGFLLQAEREALCYALGVLHERTAGELDPRSSAAEEITALLHDITAHLRKDKPRHNIVAHRQF